MKLTYQGITVCLLYAATSIVAEMDYFSSPGPNSHYKSGDTISFVVEDMPDEDDQNVNANLASLVKTIQTWNSQNVDESGEEFPFQWLVDVTESGQYYVEISVGHTRDDVTQSYPFTIEVDNEATADDATDTSQSEPSQSDYAQQMSEEPQAQEPEEPITASKKLSLNNKQSQVAHISSHSDIDTLSDDPGPSAGEETDFQPQSKLSQLATSLTSNLPLVHNKESVEPLMPKTSPSANMKQLEAADDIAVAREKAWIAQQQQSESAAHQTPSKKTKSTHKSKHHSKIDKEVKAQAKKATDKAHEQAKKAKLEEKERQTLTLAQQEAKDDRDTKHQAASHTKQKRDAYRIVMRNRAKFAKQELHIYIP